MNTTANAMPEAFEPRSATPAVSPTRPFYWSVRRELWEHRSLYLAPLIGAGVFLFGLLIGFSGHLRHAMTLDAQQLHDMLTGPFQVGAGLIMGPAFLVSIFYSLDTLYSERRDRAILFWKSLPVSDLTTVLAKASIPLLVLPVIALAITIVAEAIALLLASMILASTGLSAAMLWHELQPFPTLGLLIYHLVTVHILWYAPIYAWLMLMSAWARRAPFVWAFLPPLVLMGFEKVAFHTMYFAGFLESRVAGGREAMAGMQENVLDPGMHLTPGLFLLTPGLWIGLALAAVFLWAAARVRRSRGPF